MSNLQEIKNEKKKKKTLTNQQQQIGYFPYIWFKEKESQLHQESPTSNKQKFQKEKTRKDRT